MYVSFLLEPYLILIIAKVLLNTHKIKISN